MSSHTHTSSPVESSSKSRTPQACRNCRKRKVKCDGVRHTCGICKRRKQNCEWPNTTAPGGYRAISTPVDFRTPTPSASAMATQAIDEDGPEYESLTDEHIVVLYEEFIKTHFRIEFCGFIPNLQPARSDHLHLPHELDLAILSLALLYIGREEREKTGITDALSLSTTFATAAVKKVCGNWRCEPTIPNIQTSLILALRYFLHEADQTAWILVGSAIRMALALGLDIETDTAFPAPEREVRRRTLWSCFIMDRIMSFAAKRPFALPMPSKGLQLPCPEIAFRSAENFIGISIHSSSKPETMLLEDNISGYNILSYLIVAVRLWEGIVELWIAGGRRGFRDNSPSPGSILYAREQAVVRWLDNLPNKMRWNSQNYNLHRSLRQEACFVTIHLILHHALCLIHQEYLPHWVEEGPANSVSADMDVIVTPLSRKDPRVLDLCTRSADYIGLICRFMRTTGNDNDLRSPFLAYAAMAALNISQWKCYDERQSELRERWAEQAHLLGGASTRGHLYVWFSMTQYASTELLEMTYRLAYEMERAPCDLNAAENEQRIPIAQDPDGIVTDLLDLCKNGDTLDPWTKFPKAYKVAVYSALEFLPNVAIRQYVFRKILVAFATYRWQHEYMHFAFSRNSQAPIARLLRMGHEFSQ